MSWTESDIAKARARMEEALRRENSQYQAERRADRQLVERGAKPIPMEETKGKFGYVMRQIMAEPGIVARITDEGFDARVEGKSLDDNPHANQGPYGWWRTGWYAADENLGKV